MRNLYKGLIPLCLILCVCLGMSAYALRIYWLYDYSDVQAVNQIIEENDLDIPKNDPEAWEFVGWDNSQPKRITSIAWRNEGKNPVHFGVVDLSGLTEMNYILWQTDRTDLLIVPEDVVKINCDNGGVQALDLSGAKRLEILNCQWNELRELVLEGLPNLKSVNCENNDIVSLTLKELPSLQGISCGHNQLERLDISDCRALTNLQCNDNRLKELILSETPLLSLLICENNQLTSLNVTECYNLERLYCGYNQIRELTLRDLPEFKVLRSANNPLENVYLDNLPVLESIDCTEQRGAVHLRPGMEFVSFDYPTLTITVKAEPPEGYWLGGITGLPDDVEIVDNTAEFQLTYMDRVLEPRFWEK